MNDGERYDSWSIIINGIIDDETITGQLIRTLTVGQSFGCGPTLDQYSHKGIMKTRVDDCQFIVVAQNDYYAILNQVGNFQDFVMKNVFFSVGRKKYSKNRRKWKSYYN
jgi:Rap guanine nucleotide exchange factor 2